ncbi:divergent polysaccharide deacetylase family protein [Halioxenophilus sp. WMMB6]|uniref:divergent polysaccharide deacetylase family protein n=1 Tax=Halioxenophilus sp. WMMB6 TaxID=3073815 RepID=UPI00295F4583|nr:divergent polysaccharide deacetylase family protein [Halioxenophilus sp. WMMB6]
MIKSLLFAGRLRRLALTLCLGLAPAAHSQQAIIVIDDLGYSLMNGLAVAELPMPLTLAIIPLSPHAQTIAKLATIQGKDVIIHSPMASIDGRELDQGGLYPDMSKHEFQLTLERQLAALPQAIGLNNHMGSLLTQQPLAMSWLMQRLRAKQLFFIDSRTSSETVARQTAQSYQVTSWQRDVFLDNERDPAAILNQLLTLEQIARQKGVAVAIGHPYEETIAVLSEQSQPIRRQGLVLVTPSKLLNEQLLARKTEN